MFFTVDEIVEYLLGEYKARLQTFDILNDCPARTTSGNICSLVMLVKTFQAKDMFTRQFFRSLIFQVVRRFTVRAKRNRVEK
jgi:hypothetical protein